MYPTLELRWFLEGEIPPELLAWFRRQNSQPTPLSSRVDYYLRLQDDDSLGIKLREGRIELKQRHRRLGPLRLHPRVTGLAGHWRKWSFPVAGPEAGLTELATPTSAWIAVKKTRQLLRYQLTPEKQVRPAPADREPDRGFELELGRIEVAGRQWATLCFEAFGREAVLQETLLLTTRPLLEAIEPPLLDLEDSYSYPRWLLMIE